MLLIIYCQALRPIVVTFFWVGISFYLPVNMAWLPPASIDRYILDILWPVIHEGSYYITIRVIGTSGPKATVSQGPNRTTPRTHSPRNWTPDRALCDQTQSHCTEGNLATFRDTLHSTALQTPPHLSQTPVLTTSAENSQEIQELLE